MSTTAFIQEKMCENYGTAFSIFNPQPHLNTSALLNAQFWHNKKQKKKTFFIRTKKKDPSHLCNAAKNPIKLPAATAAG